MAAVLTASVKCGTVNTADKQRPDGQIFSLALLLSTMFLHCMPFLGTLNSNTKLSKNKEPSKNKKKNPSKDKLCKFFILYFYDYHAQKLQLAITTMQISLT